MSSALRELAGKTSQDRVTAALVDLQGQVYREARAAAGPVPQLMTWLLDRRNLAAAWERVRAADGADTPGPDGMTCAALRDRAGPWLTRLADDLLHGRYRPAAPRWVEIPKPQRPGAVRRLGILNIRDRVVQAALKQILEPILELLFLPTSFGFRPGRSVPGALAEAVRLLTPAGNKPPPFGFALPLDIANCFDEIDHRLLEEQLAACVSDPDVCRLLGVLLAAGGKEVGCLWWRRACGLVQGSTLSPLLCNLALQPLDEALADAGRQRGGDVVLLRYADDLLLLGRDSRAAHQGLSVVQAALSRLRLALRNPVPLLRPVVEGFNWLGVTVCPRASYGHGRMIFGYVIPTDRVTRMLERLDEMTVPPSERIEAGAFNLSRWVVSINAQLRDWHQAYRFADNALDVFRAVDDHARGRLGAMLGSILGKRWTDLRRQYARHLPRGFWTWEVDGCRLTLLSALAPHSPANLQHRPAWMRAATGGGGSRSNSHGERPPLVSNKPAPANGHDDGASPPPPDLAPAPGSLLITPPDLRS